MKRGGIKMGNKKLTIPDFFVLFATKEGLWQQAIVAVGWVFFAKPCLSSIFIWKIKMVRTVKEGGTQAENSKNSSSHHTELH